MPIINLRKYYYPTIRKDAFVEVSGEVAEALEEGLRIERRQEKKKLYHKVFSMDTNDWTQLHIPSMRNRRRMCFSGQKNTLNRSVIYPAWPKPLPI